jgi:uncharacterized protein YjbI with pentapeptide repeats
MGFRSFQEKDRRDMEDENTEKGVKHRLRAWLPWVAVLALVLALAALVVLGYHQPWTGFGRTHDAQGEWRPAKTLWDWLVLLLPAQVVAVIAAYEVYRRRAQTRLEVDRSREAALQEYLNVITDLLKAGLLQSKPADIRRDIARARTLMLLRQLDGARKGAVLRFLSDTGLLKGRPDAIVSMDKSDLRKVDLSGADLPEMDLGGANLRGANLRGTGLSRSYLEEADLRGADLSRADLGTAKLVGADLSRANLSQADLSKADLTGAVLRRANLTRADLTGIVQEGFRLRWVNLRGTDLESADVRVLDLSGAKLHKADLRGADLTRANLTGADLREAILTMTKLEGADLGGANLSGAIMREADLREANLSGAKLRKTSLNWAYLNEAKVTDEQLAQAKSLEGATLPDGTRYTGEDLEETALQLRSAPNDSRTQIPEGHAEGLTFEEADPASDRSEETD